MKRLNVVLLSLIVAATGFARADTAAADPSTPDGALHEIIDTLKSTRDPASILNYIDWPSAFGRLKPEQKVGLGVNTAEDFKSTMVAMIKDPAEFIRKRLAASMPAGHGDNPGVAAALDVGIKAAQEQARRMREKIMDTNFEVGSPTRNGNEASVPLTTTLDGQTRTTKVELELVNGRWLLSSLGLVGGVEAHGGSVEQ